MRTWTFISALTGAAIAICACNLPVADKESDGIARAFYDEVRTGADLTRDPHVSPALETDEAQAELAQIRAVIPAGPLTAVHNTGWHYATSTETGSSAQLGHAYDYAGKTIRIQTIMQKAPGQTSWSIVGFQAGLDGAATAPIVVGVAPRSPGDID
jgi:hypothetical protein